MPQNSNLVNSTANTRLRGLDIGFIITTAVLLFNGWFLFYNFTNVREQTIAVERGSKIINELDLVLLSAVDAETGFRGFLLARKDEYLEPYNSGIKEIWTHYQNVGTLIEKNPEKVNLWQMMGELITDRLKIFSDRIALEKGRVKRDDMNFVTEGKVVMDSLRRHVAMMQEEERAALRESANRAQLNQYYFLGSLVLTTLLGLIIILIAFIQVRKNQIRIVQDNLASARDAWIKENLANLSAAVAGDLSVQNMAHSTLEKLASTLKTLAGNFYILDSGHLKLAGQYAASNYKSNIATPMTVSVGDGIIGEAFHGSDIQEIKNVPSEYFNISSSLGSAIPNSLVFIPITFQGSKIGIIEVASFEQLSEDGMKYLTNARDMIGVGMNASQSRERLQAYLEETQTQAEELQAQQEELKTNNEELEQQTRALESQQQMLSLRNAELGRIREDLEIKAKDLESASQYKSEFLAKMSHELRTPLNSLLILATLLIENKENNLSDQQRDFARSIHGAGNDLLNLINDILDLSKIEARKLSLRPEAIRVKSLLERMRTTFEPQARTQGLEFKIELDPELETFQINTDQQRLEQILRNFLSNALKFTEKGQITLVCELANNKHDIKFSVKDTGIGIANNKKELVFEAFEQADSSVSRKYGGTGLGLTISRELAHLLGGGINLQSEEGKGSEFTLQIPSHLPSQAGDVHIAPLAPITQPKREAPRASDLEVAREANEALKFLQGVQTTAKSILIVEDDEKFRHSVAEVCRSYGFEPVEASHGEVALQILQNFTPNAILLDIKLPGISGMGLLEMVKQMPRLRHVPIHMISAMEYQQSALRMGAMGFLGKPVTLDKIRSALDRIENLLAQKMKRLLIVEDDDRQREAIKHLVTGSDIEIFMAHTGKEALNAVKERGFDCIILDLSLPDVTGFEFLDQLHDLDISIPPIVIYTGREISRQEEEHLRKYSESIIIKGARSPERLLDEVNLFLHRVEASLPQEQKQMLNQLRSQEKIFEGKTVLVVDDDLRNVFALTSAMESKGFQVRIARDGVEALESLEKFDDIDVVLMDIMMPRMDGFEATRAIRKMDKYKSLPIIALTAKAMKEDHEKCIEAGANDYLPKPINLMNLVSVLKVWLTPKGIFE